MNTIKFFTFAICICISAALFAQNGKDGNQNIVKLQKKTLYSGAGFSSLKIDRIGKVVLAYGPVSKIEIECPADELSSIKAKQSGNRVSVRSKKSTAVQHSTLYVTLNSDKLKLDANAVGRIESSGILPMETIDIAGVSIGSIQMEVKSSRMTLDGKALGNVVLAGISANSRFRIDAIGQLDCSELKLDGAQVRVKASTNIQLNVSTFLELDLYACPSVSVIGQPIVKVLHKDPQVSIKTIN
jgi:hypothetical protein